MNLWPTHSHPYPEHERQAQHVSSSPSDEFSCFTYAKNYFLSFHSFSPFNKFSCFTFFLLSFLSLSFLSLSFHHLWLTSFHSSHFYFLGFLNKINLVSVVSGWKPFFEKVKIWNTFCSCWKPFFEKVKKFGIHFAVAENLSLKK